MTALLVRQFGPFTRGLIQGASPDLDLTGALRAASNVRLDGVHRMRADLGTLVAMTFQDDATTPADCTTVCGLAPFKDRVLVVAHSTATSKAYLYLVASDFSGYYDTSDALTTGTTAAPLGALWTSIDDPPVVRIAEGLGVGYVAHAAAADSSSLNWPSKSLTLSSGTWTIATMTSDLDDDSTAEDLYFSGVIPFQQHLWAWGFGGGTTAADGFRPELARFSKAIFDASADPNPGDLFAPDDSITFGDRVRSVREGILAAAVGGDALILASNRGSTMVRGYGRDSWQRTVLDRAYGVVGPQALCGAGTAVYGWSFRGLWRVVDGGAPEPLWDAVPDLVATIENGGAPDQTMVAFDPDNDRVSVIYQADATDGVIASAAFDVRRQVWIGKDTSTGVEVFSGLSVAPVFTVDSPPAGPSAAPTVGTVTSITTSSAHLPWTNGDATAETEVWVKQHSDTTYTLAATRAAGVTSYDYTGLLPDTEYDWKVRHTKNGQTSDFAAGTSFTTKKTTDTGGMAAPTGLNFFGLGLVPNDGTPNAGASWSNGAQANRTEIWVAGPSATAPVDSDYGLVLTTASPSTGSAEWVITTTTGTYWCKVRHTDGVTTSAFTSADSATITQPSGSGT